MYTSVMLISLYSHISPDHDSRQLQVKPPYKFVHIPSCKHGPEEQ